MRNLSFVFTAGLAGLFLALPARAQEEPADAAEGDAPAADKPAEETKPAASPAAAADASGQVSLQATAEKPAIAMEGAAEAGAESPPATAPLTASPSQRGADAADTSWKMEYHGYLRAPMRIGMGKRDNPLEGQSETTLHYPVLPDDQYLSWQSTSHNKKDWAEMFFTIGNELASGTLALQGFNFTDASWTDPTSQFGISQGFVTLTPDLGYENVRLSVKAGSFWARYGMAGKWDAGEYDTYLFGRLHQMGELIHVEFDIDDANTLWFEHGIGTKRPDPSQFNNAKFTLVHHAHVGFKAGAGMEFSAHYIHSWAQEEDRIHKPYNTATAPGEPLQDTYNPVNYPSTLQNQPDGKLWVAGLDARFELGAFGYLYAGYSHIGAEDSLSVGPAIEVLHAFGGGAFQLGVADNYFGPSCQGGPDTSAPIPQPITQVVSPPNAGAFGTEFGCSLGTGKVDSVLAQYEFSLTNFLQQIEGGQKFWGDGPDARIALYGMFNKVTSDVEGYDGNTKIKYGTDVQFGLLPWLTFATRYDRVQPHSDFPEQSFSIVSPRLVFKSQWLTREQISLQYSRYIYNQRECEGGVTPAFNTAGGGSNLFMPGQLNCVQPPAAPGSAESFGSYYLKQEAGLRGAPTTRPDVNVIKVEASMWW